MADARVTLKRTFAWASESATGPATSVSGLFRNEEDVGAYGVATAQVKTSTATYTNTSAETYFPPHEDVTVTLIVEGIAYEQYLSCSIYLSEVESIGCPDCGGTEVFWDRSLSKAVCLKDKTPVSEFRLGTKV